MKIIVFASVVLFTVTLQAQVLDSPAGGGAPVAPKPAAPATAPGGGGGAPAAGAPGKQNSFLGKDVPLFDPGSNILTWDGKSWNVTNNELFQARFEKYLDAPEETGADDKAYQAIIKRILDDLAPGNQTVKSVDEAFSLLPKASNYDIDAHLCDALADAVYSAWRAQNQAARLDVANAALSDELKKHEWNAQVISQGLQMDAPRRAKMARRRRSSRKMRTPSGTRKCSPRPSAWWN